ncbi:hypothetical protein Anapl_11231 [Anas platyrhynchos]|uniref:Uncharacterized protein n=1 Tax=Anas platyrhynchos TaxID=8839 RepID=R0KTC7_ANAPL|nr:hypothetical protein Anapl_11231 [Anas platyrhynchos]
MQGVEGERVQTRGKNIAHIQQRSTAWSKQGCGLFISPPEESQIMKFKAVCRADKTRKFKCRTSSSKSQCCPLGCHYSIEVGKVIKNKWMHTSQTVIAYLTLVSIIICFSKGVRHEFFDCPELPNKGFFRYQRSNRTTVQPQSILSPKILVQGSRFKLQNANSLADINRVFIINGSAQTTKASGRKKPFMGKTEVHYEV